jgi:hypothetical protein
LISLREADGALKVERGMDRLRFIKIDPRRGSARFRPASTKRAIGN